MFVARLLEAHPARESFLVAVEKVEGFLRPVPAVVAGAAVEVDEPWSLHLRPHRLHVLRPSGEDPGRLFAEGLGCLAPIGLLVVGREAQGVDLLHCAVGPLPHRAQQPLGFAEGEGLRRWSLGHRVIVTRASAPPIIGRLRFAFALVAYSSAVLAVGGVVSRRAARSREAFLVGDRRFGRLSSWAAISSTTIGGSTTLVLAALVAANGLSGLWLDLAGVAGLAFLGLALARQVRATGALTLAEVIGRFYGPGVRRVAAFLIVLAEIVWFALLTQATEIVVTTATSWPGEAVLVATAAIFIAYTALGGQRAVIGTDVLQFGLMVFCLLGIALPSAIVSLTMTGLPVRLLSFPFSATLGPKDVAALFVLVGLPHAVGSDVWSKLLSARDEATARVATLWAASSKLVFGLAVAAIALAGAGAGQPGGPSLFPRAVLLLSGPVLAPLLFVAMIATMQSSSDSVLLSAAAATVHDLLPGRSDPSTSPFRLRIFVVLHGLLGLLVALWLRDLLETFRLGYTIFASGLILPTLAGFSRRFQVDRRYAAAAMILGGGVAVTTHFLRATGVDPVLVGTAVNAGILSLGFRRRPRA